MGTALIAGRMSQFFPAAYCAFACRHAFLHFNGSMDELLTRALTMGKFQEKQAY